MSRRLKVLLAVIGGVTIIIGGLMYAFRTIEIDSGGPSPTKVTYRWGQPHKLEWDESGDGRVDRIAFVEVVHYSGARGLSNREVWVDSNSDGQMDFQFLPAPGDQFVAMTDPDADGRFQNTIRGADARALYCKWIPCGPDY